MGLHWGLDWVSYNSRERLDCYSSQESRLLEKRVDSEPYGGCGS